MTAALARTRWLDACPAPKPGLIVQPVDGEAVIYDPDADRLHHLVPTAAAVWAQLGDGQSVHAVASDIAGAVGVPAPAIRDDVLSLVAVLHERGLLAGSVAAPSSAGRQPARPPSRDFDLGGQPLPATHHVTRAFRGLEHAFEVATNEPAIRDYLDEILTDLSDASPDTPSRHDLIVLSKDRYLVRSEGKTVVATGRLDRALAVLLWHINAEVVRRSALRYPLVHAAAAVRNGATVLLPAPPEGGKTTTVAGLVERAGFGYLSDEAVAIDPATLLAHAYPKPLSIDRGSWEVLADLCPPHADRVTGQWQLPASSIKPDAVAKPAPIRFVIEPAYDRHAGTGLEPVSKGTMLARLADSTFTFQDAPQRNLDVLARVVEQADCYRLKLSDLDDAVRLIRSLFDSAD